MSKVITLPNKFEIEDEEGKPNRFIKNPWVGSVALADPMTLPQAEAIDEVRTIILGYDKEKRLTFTSLDKPHLSAILACVEKWDIPNLPTPTLDNFPMSPLRARHEFIDFIWKEVQDIYYTEEEIPNE